MKTPRALPGVVLACAACLVPVTGVRPVAHAAEQAEPAAGDTTTAAGSTTGAPASSMAAGAASSVAGASASSATAATAPPATTSSANAPAVGTSSGSDAQAAPSPAGDAAASPDAAAAPAQAAPAAAPPAPTRAAAPPPKPRVSLLPLVQPLWSELTPVQQQILAPIEPQWNALPLEKKRTWIRVAERLPKMNETQRARAMERIREWAQLTPEQRRLARNNYRLAKQLPKDDRVASWEQYQQMTPEQRSVLRFSGWTSNTAARHAGAPTGLAKQAARPLPGVVPPAVSGHGGLPKPPTPPAPAPTNAR